MMTYHNQNTMLLCLHIFEISSWFNIKPGHDFYGIIHSERKYLLPTFVIPNYNIKIFISSFHPLHYINVLNLAILCSKFTRATFYRVCRKQTYREFKELTNDNVDKSKFQCMSAYTQIVKERVEREREREKERDRD